jgi:hypothetical protein
LVATCHLKHHRIRPKAAHFHNVKQYFARVEL